MKQNMFYIIDLAQSLTLPPLANGQEASPPLLQAAKKTSPLSCFQVTSVSSSLLPRSFVVYSAVLQKKKKKGERPLRCPRGILLLLRPEAKPRNSFRESRKKLRAHVTEHVFLEKKLWNKNRLHYRKKWRSTWKKPFPNLLASRLKIYDFAALHFL